MVPKLKSLQTICKLVKKKGYSSMKLVAASEGLKSAQKFYYCKRGRVWCGNEYCHSRY